MAPEKRKTIVYIDGYNWYHGVFKHHPEWKWLNIVSFFEQTLHREDVHLVKLFSAMVDAHLAQSDAFDRQERYFTALRTLPKAKVILGSFQERGVKCRGACGENYMIREEKKTDVNIAVEMIDDVLNVGPKHLCVVSGDSDVQPAVEWIAKLRPSIAITVYVPCLPSEQPGRRTDYYITKGIKNVSCGFLPLSRLRDFQLPNCVKLSTGKLAIRPSSWNYPPKILNSN